ncbi:MAG: helix-turn-helix transcriptional regulator [Dysgonamonadaceae bacterium]|jgi:transcriptional regulator with XRE-family HTH domain|nr:helix-turn-helix transcriptional regulator [Dysgonamonadaceae bacterium]
MDKISSGKIHQGHNVKRLREMLGVKQEILAEGIGLSQQSVSRMENQEQLDEQTMDKIAAFLHIPVDAIKNFDEENAVNFIANNFHKEAFQGTIIGSVASYTPSFNPLDKVIELYERMLKERDERIAALEQLLKNTDNPR